MTDYYFGEVLGQPVGTPFESRVAAKDARVHQVTQQGIAGNRHVGCASIVLSGGYDTDEDYGHEIFYTGAGGQNPNDPRGPHIADQDLDKSDNAALIRSEETGLPIRIVRGAQHKSPHSPATHYRYDGLYRVVKHYPLVHDGDGFLRWMFHLVQFTAEEAEAFTPSQNAEVNAAVYAKLDLGSGTPDATDGSHEAGGGTVDPYFTPVVELPAGNAAPGARIVTSQRVIRDTKVTAAVKSMYSNACQICSTRVPTVSGHYSEGAHIRPLGKPHHGPDKMSNILCLCPNHHSSFDKGGLLIDDEFNTFDLHEQPLGQLKIHPGHEIDLNHLRYHRAHHGFATMG